MSPGEVSKVPLRARLGLLPRHRLIDSLVRGHTARILRFVVSGALSTALYAAVVWTGTSKLGVAPLTMNLVGYACALPVNFLLHRNYTFVALHDFANQARKFVIVHAFNLATSSAVYVVTDLAGSPILFGILGACIVVPLVQFLALDRWVFRPAVSAPSPGKSPLPADAKTCATRM